MMAFVPKILLLLFLGFAESANILTIIPFPSYSHQQPLLSVSKELAIRGHKLTVITPNPPKEPIPNYTVIDVSSAYQRLKEMSDLFGFTLQKEWANFPFIRLIPALFKDVCDYELGLPQVQKFIREANQTKFDLVLIEDLLYSSYNGLVHKVGSPPVVGIHTFAPSSFTDMFMGVPSNPSYIPELFSGYTDEMDFVERIYNTLLFYYVWYTTEMEIIPEQEKVLRKYFGPDPPHVRELEANKSLVLLPCDSTVAYPQPLPPNYIQIGPLHIEKAKPLPKDLQQWLDGATEGAVYFSLGSNMQGTSLRPEKRDAFLKSFAKFPKVRFIWKYESEQPISGLPDNLLIRKWLPQQDILKHPKLKLFITQGGLQSTEEAIYHGIPVLGIPLFADQRHQIWKMRKEGAALSLEMHEVNFDSVHESLKDLLSNKRYKENAERLSSITKDHQQPAMDTAIWWIEYTLRHNGARHLRVASLKLHWYQYFLIDVHAFLILVLGLSIYLPYILVRTCVRKFRNSDKTTKKRKTK